MDLTTRVYGSFDRYSARLANYILLPAAIVASVSIAIALVTPKEPLKQFFDNVHWTLSFGVAAALAWLGSCTGTDPDRKARRLFAIGLTLYALGQVVWDLEAAFSQVHFPDFSDIFYLCPGPFIFVAMLACLRRSSSRANFRAALLDVAGLATAVLTFVLAIYLPRHQTQTMLQMVVLVAYPVVLLGTACLGFVLLLSLHLKMQRGWILFQIALVGNGLIWLEWNSLSLDGALRNGTWYNAVFSIMALVQGLGAMMWRTEESSDPRWIKGTEGVLRTLPLFVVVVAAASIVFAYLIPSVPSLMEYSAVIGGLVVVVISSIRHNLTLGERDALIRAERSLLSMENRFSATLDLVPVPVAMITHPEGLFVLANAAYRELYPFEIGRRPSQVNLFRDTTERDRIIRSLDELHRLTAEEVVLRDKSGREHLTLLSAEIVDAYGGSHATLVALDIQERRDVEQALRSSEELTQSILQTSLDAVILKDEHGLVRDWNAQAERTFGYSVSEALGKSMVDLIIPQTQRESYQNVIFEYVNSDDRTQQGRRFELSAVRRSGEVFPAELAVTPIGSKDRLFFSVFVRDLTEQRRAEETKSLLEAQLRQSQKMEAVGTLAAGIAHDFNNVLSAIRGNADLASEDISPSSQASTSIEEIKRAARRASSLVQQIVAFSRQHEEPREILNLEAITSEVVQLLRSTLPASVSLRIAVAQDTPLVIAASTQMHQVLLNLCTNSWQAMESRPGEITISIERAEIVQGGSIPLDAGTYALMSVADQGHGIAPDNLQRIFEPFFTTKTLGQGTGLGLSVVHSIVQNHRGLIYAESEIGRGTTFRIYLPATSNEAKVGIEQASTHRSTGAGRHVVYLDDEAPLVFLVDRALTRRGYRVSALTSAEEAITLVRDSEHEVDIVVTDYNMPHLSGMDVAKTLRALRPQLPIVLISGYVTEAMRAEATSVGIQEIVHKPDSIDELCQTIESLVPVP